MERGLIPVKNETNVHAGHRANTRKKFLTVGPDAFLPHEFLELLLYYAVPMCDTNPTAHRLMDRFGTLEGVFSASRGSLTEVPGVGDRVVDLLHLFRVVGERAETESERDDQPQDSRSLGEYVLSLFEGEDEDCTRLILMDNAFRLLDVRKVYTGDFSAVGFRTRILIEPALRKHASMAVLASSHRNRVARANLYEVEATRRFREAFELVGVRLLEHYIVNGNYYTQISRQIPGGLAENPDFGRYFRSEGRGEAGEEENGQF